MNRHLPIDRFEQEFKELVRDWERFFAGITRTPPEKDRIAFGQKLRRITEAGGIPGTDQYRLQQLQHKFSSYSQMWERMLREREEGRGRSMAHLRAASRAAAQQEGRGRSPKPDVAERAPVQQGKGDDLFEDFVAAKRRVGQSSSLKREAFQAQLESQREQIESRLGHKVRFEVVVDGDKVKLTARKTGGSDK